MLISESLLEKPNHYIYIISLFNILININILKKKYKILISYSISDILSWTIVKYIYYYNNNNNKTITNLLFLIGTLIHKIYEIKFISDLSSLNLEMTIFLYYATFSSKLFYLFKLIITKNLSNLSFLRLILYHSLISHTSEFIISIVFEKNIIILIFWYICHNDWLSYILNYIIETKTNLNWYDFIIF